MSLRENPYRLFFPLGLLYALWGGLVWTAFATGLITGYPGFLHAEIMIGGFLGAFASGFLMTAVPKFTRTYPPRASEMLFVVIPLAALPLLALLDSALAVPLGLLTGLAGLVKFGIERVRRRQANPPPSFLFLGLGLGSAVVGLTLVVASRLSIFGAAGETLGKLLFLQCFNFSLVIGVGSRLVPALLGWGPAPLHGGKLQSLKNQKGPLTFGILAALFLVSFLAEAFVSGALGWWLRFVLIAIVAFRFWMIHKLPISRSKVAWSLWMGCWMFLIGSGGSALFPLHHVAFLHLSFIGGLALITLMIATRVVIAHGGFNLALESQLRTLWLIPGLLIVAALLRAFAPETGVHYLTTLAFASVVWSLAIIAWFVAVGIKVFNRA